MQINFESRAKARNYSQAVNNGGKHTAKVQDRGAPPSGGRWAVVVSSTSRKWG